jgi:hypothetical protein
MTRAARWAYLVLAWLFVAGLVVQVFYAGMGIFAGARNFETHVALGWTLHLAPLLILLAAALSRAGRRHWGWALALAAVVFTIPIFVLARADSPVIAALHPVSALVAFWIAVVVARNAFDAVRQTDAPPAPPAEASA